MFRHACRMCVVAACCLLPMLASAGGLVADHTCTDLGQIPEYWIGQAITNLRIHYAHTSHGSQLISGIETLEGLNARYNVDVGYQSLGTDPEALRIFDGQEDNTYISPDLYWEEGYGRERTRDVLNNNPTINVSMWAWCGQVGYYGPEAISNYLHQMTSFETQFPDVVFIYMTGHLDASGPDGTLHRQNEMIREYCRTYNKVLYDFGDIGRYDPNGTDYLPLGGGGGDGDECQYDSGNWGTEWCEDNPGSPLCADCSCAHSQSLNCNLKGRALWWLLARLAGWPGAPTGGCAQIGNGSVGITWGGLCTGRVYEVHRSGSLVPPAWTNAGIFTNGSGCQHGWQEPTPTNPACFYRLKGK